MQKVIAGNWKMFKNPAEVSEYTKKFTSLLKEQNLSEKEVILFVPSINLSALAMEQEKEALAFSYGVQNFYPEKEGAFTGETSLMAAKELHTTWALIGHSERRTHFFETDAFLAKKVAFAMNNKYRVVFCIGETLEEREAGKLEEVLKEQLFQGLINLPAEYKTQDLVIAYEPVWAIGTGKVASEADIKAAHALVRTLLLELLPNKAKETCILYGGSVNPKNAKEILQIENVDGVLVGGASLKVDDFNAIVNS